MSDLRPYGGTVQRGRPEYDHTIGGPMQARVRVIPLDGGRLGFEVLAEYVGCGLPDLPPTDHVVDVSDTLVSEHLGEALAVATEASRELSGGHEPDLRKIVLRVRSAIK